MYKLKILTFVACLAIAVTPFRAQAEGSDFTVSPKVFERLSKAQEALNNKEYAKALKELKVIERRMKPNDHESALVFQTRGYVFAGKENYKAAAKEMEKAWKKNALPEQTQVTLLYNIGQIQMAAEDYKGASATFDKWLKVAEKPSAQALYTVAASKYQTKDYRGAIKNCKAAIASSKKPKDSWYQLMLSSYFTLKQFRPAIGIQTILVERHPDKRTGWMQLVGLYSQVNDDKRSLAVLQLAYKMGVLKEKSDYVQLAQRFQAAEIPLEAAEVLEEAIGGKKLKIDAEVAKIVGNAYFAAREDAKAAPALKRAAGLAKDGELYLRLAQLQSENEKWEAAVNSARQALKKGGLKSPGRAHMLLGIAEARRGRNVEARKAFVQASRIPAVARTAKGWIDYIARTEASGN